MKILYANGDSWTCGEEMFDNDPMAKTNRYFSTWPWQLCQNLDMSLCVNESAGGGSNDRIFRKTNEFIFNWLSQKKNTEDLMIVLGWTTPERFEFLSDEYIKVTIQNSIFSKPETPDLKKLREIYFKNIDVNKSLLKQIMYMINLRTLCKNVGIKYYDFIAIGDPMFVINEISFNTYGINLDKESLHDETWNSHVYKNSHSVHALGHPTAQSNKLWADFLANKIK